MVHVVSGLLGQSGTSNVTRVAWTMFGLFTTAVINELKEIKQVVESIYVSVDSKFSPDMLV